MLFKYEVLSHYELGHCQAYKILINKKEESDICTPIFAAELFTIAKTWIDEWMDKEDMIYMFIYILIYYSQP